LEKNKNFTIFENVKFEKTDFESFVSDIKYDFIIFCHSFYYLNHKNALKKSCEMLNDSGKILITIDNGEMWSVIKEFSLKDDIYVYPNLLQDIQSFNFETKQFPWKVDLSECFNPNSQDQLNLLNWMTFSNFISLPEELQHKILSFLKKITNQQGFLCGSEHLVVIHKLSNFYS
jgi:hypothetical protein